MSRRQSGLGTEGSLGLFHPIVQRWFRRSYSAPTDIQARSWPAITEGRHVLLIAPTGSGKTLCAFLWAIDRLLTGAWSCGSTRVLYVSPLKALNNDIRRNLVRPLREIRELFASEGDEPPDIRVFTRSGDTPSRERQLMLRRPPEILITTPESLNLLLSSPRARENLRSLRTVILDEIHAVASDKRGTHLITAVERLTGLSGEFQRLVLSATVRPVEHIADWVGGYRLVRSAAGAEGGRGEAVYEKREVTVLASAGGDAASTSKRLELRVRAPGGGLLPGRDPTAVPPPSPDGPPVFPAVPPPSPDGPSAADSAREAFWADLVREIKARIRANRATLIFTNTRRHAERLARMINEGEDTQLAYAHHGSLSREIRLVVERRLKAGELSAIVATSSLELGIDIGELDEVLLVQTPFSVSSTLQRIGRAGHGVGQVSRGRLYCTHGRDLLNAALMARSIGERDIEQIRPVECPLDLLAQIILSMSGMRAWRLAELYDALRCSSPYHDLPWKHFELVVEMLAGRCGGRYLRELRPRLSLDRLENTVRAHRGAMQLVYRSGGTIPDRGYYELRVGQNGSKIGELDEEFVWERKVGDAFNLGTQNWKIVRIDSRTVEVIPWSGPINLTPFWKAERAGRDFHFSEKIAEFLELWNDRLEPPAQMIEALASGHSMDERSAEVLVRFLGEQRAATGAELPHRHHLLVEHVEGPPARASFNRVILHTLWGARVNYPFSLILQAAWAKAHPGSGIEAIADDDCVLIIPSDPEGFSAGRMLSLIGPGDVEKLLRNSLETSGFFGARFRENAGRALLLPRSTLDRRIPLWLTRLRAKKLLESVASCGEFPILIETWRSCLQDEFDLSSLELVLAELSRGQIRRSEVRTAFPSPFAGNISWIQTNLHTYRGDEPSADGLSAVRGDTIHEILYSSRLRPRIEAGPIEMLQSKLQRTAPGYAPEPSEELLDWVKERIAVQEGEWGELLDAVRRDHGAQVDPVGAPKLIRYRMPGAEEWVVSALEQLPRIVSSLALEGGQEPEALLEALEVDEDRFGSGVRARARRAFAGFQPEEAGPDLPSLVGQWLRFYGPVGLSRLSRCFGLSPQRLQTLLGGLVESRTVVVDRLTREAGEEQVCDAENLEILLRLSRRAAQPAFRALALERLPLFLALQQGLTGRGGGPSGLEDLRDVLETLFGFPAGIRQWEEEIFPARLEPYRPSWLDELLRGSELQWFGCGRQRVSFCFSSDLELFLELQPEGTAEELRRLLPSSRGRFSFWDLVDHSGVSPAEAGRAVWELVWKGGLAADSFEVLRRAGASLQGRAPDRPAQRRHGRGVGRRSGRGGYERWRSSHPLSGSWYGIEVSGETDALEEEELARDRVRQLLRRYGIVFRELLARELPALQWSRLFRTLRVMELSGEIFSGYFFEGIGGLQFTSQKGLRSLQAGLPEEAIYWICAQDPASACGLGLPIPGLPSRLATTHLVYHGARLVLVSRRRGGEVELRAPAEDPSLPRYFRLFSDFLGRDAAPRKSVRVERINGLAARESPYREAFVNFGFVQEYTGLVLRAGF